MNDPINPAHYNGTACAQIGERLSGNSYQILKYNWRLGKKDDPVIEIGKSIWYLDRELQIAKEGFLPNTDIPSDEFFFALLRGVDPFVGSVAWNLVNWNRYADSETIIHLRRSLIKRRSALEAEATGQHQLEV